MEADLDRGEELDLNRAKQAIWCVRQGVARLEG